MAGARAELEGAVIAHLIRFIGIAVWAPDKLPEDLNPFGEKKPESEAMRRHREGWAKARWRASMGA